MYGYKPICKYVFAIVFIYPPFSFAKIITDIGILSFDKNGAKGPGYPWSSVFNSSIYYGAVVPSTYSTYWILLFDAIFYALLAFFFENVMKSGSSRPIYFIFTREFWSIEISTLIEDDTEMVETSHLLKDSDRDMEVDVIDEDARVFRSEKDAFVESDDESDQAGTINSSPGQNPNIRIMRLNKTYNPPMLPELKAKFKAIFNCICCCFRPKQAVSEEEAVEPVDQNPSTGSGPVKALVDLSLLISKGELFCLLGHNGAGKTTTINMMTGLFPPSSGTINFFGLDLRYQMDSIRKLMGICPQHDILWPDLTAREHLDIFAELKNVPSDKKRETVDELLRSVRLFKVGNNRVSTYSGGMKRRLSVAISCIGDPQIIIMDEPTTGMDPISKRHIWDLIQRLKKDRVVILTTHAMDEADALGDRIAVLAMGKLRCIGNGLHLKNKYGEGYRVNIQTDQENVENVKHMVKSKLPNSNVLAENGTRLTFGVPLECIALLSPFFRFLETDPTAVSIIREWGVSHTTLEEVFMKVTKKFSQCKPHVDQE
eukprot:TRINITY_DN4021_c0_g1_i1.p1 TRINITY_DN4021_c0_g1~~TRINITY_DN4021_c0_g1_i1.p1  ORF type:complete len:542 (+),score=151.80 TRINITY_DN4021_c0_g1_i1:1123-2748(+)